MELSAATKATSGKESVPLKGKVDELTGKANEVELSAVAVVGSMASNIVDSVADDE